MKEWMNKWYLFNQPSFLELFLVWPVPQTKDFDYFNNFYCILIMEATNLMLSKIPHLLEQMYDSCSLTYCWNLLFAVCWKTCQMMCRRDRQFGVRMTLEWSVSVGGTFRTVSDSSTAHSDAALCSTLTSRTTRAPHWDRPTIPLATRCLVTTGQGLCSWTMMQVDLTDSVVDSPCVTGMHFIMYQVGLRTLSIN